jgi:hypothetical protein
VIFVLFFFRMHFWVTISFNVMFCVADEKGVDLRL